MAVKGKLCLKNLVAFYDTVTALVDNGRITEIIYLNSCKLFGILVSTLERHEAVTGKELAG